MTRLFLGLLAEWEWEKIHERTTTGLINAAKGAKSSPAKSHRMAGGGCSMKKVKRYGLSTTSNKSG